MARNASPVKETAGEATAAHDAPAGAHPTQPQESKPGAPQGSPELVATIRGTVPIDQVGAPDPFKDVVKMGPPPAPLKEPDPTPTHDVYAKDGMLSTDPRARRAEPPPAKRLEWRDGKVVGKAAHLDAGPPPTQYRVVADARYIAPGGMPVVLRAGKIVMGVTHNLEAMRRQGVRIEELH